MKDTSKKTRPLKRHFILMKVLRFLVGWFFRLRFNFKFMKIKLQETPSLVLINHNSDYDPIFTGMIFKDHLYFVTSEHLLGIKVFGKLIRYIFDPIIRVKGTTESRAAIEILKTLKKGLNVCLFAEGNRSYNGETDVISPATAKLVKRSGAALVTYNIKGAYLSTPRWGNGVRRGMVKGDLVNFYSKEQIAELSNEEINEIIVNDLYVNAYEDQKKYNVKYLTRNKDYAEGIETALYICPNCGSISTIKSKGNRFYCSCGLDMIYTEYGWLANVNGEPPKFDNILDWDRWQLIELHRILSESTDTLKEVFSDSSQTLYEIGPEAQRTEIITGTLHFFRDRLVFTNDNNTVDFYFSNIDDIEVTGRMTNTFVTKDKKYYEIKALAPRPAKKYRDSFRILQGKTN